VADESQPNRIAIVGMAGRFPRSPDLASFWANVRDGVELTRFFSDEELRRRGVDPALLADPSFVKAASTLDGIEEFDADFFGILPKMAAIMDPQHRLLLECAWEALEDAGYDSERIRGLTGLYAGAAMNGYLVLHLVGNPEAASAGFVSLQLANDKDYMPSRVAFKLNLRGPTYLVQSACSTSLVAIHVAAQSLLNHECDLALAGAVAGLVHNRHGYQYVEGGLFSPDGHCRSYDAGGKGTVFGSGVGLVVLKRLEDALADGDTIRAVLLGSAVNNDGALKAGYTAPSVEGQAEVITEALANAGVGAASISYLEGQGTATQLGDSIEIQAVTRAFRAHTDQARFCALGSLKSNLGHLDVAGGVAGLMKTVLALEHRQLPPSLHCTTPNPGVDWERSPLYVNTRLRDWSCDGPRRAGVSSFGIGGTNAHVIVEEAPPAPPASPAPPAQLLVLSARTPAALAAMTARLADHLEQHPELALADVAYTLQLGRRVFAERRALPCRDRAGAVAALRAPADTVGRQEQRDRPVVFLIADGAEVPALGALYDEVATVRKHVDAAAAKLQALAGIDVRPWLRATTTGPLPPPELAEAARLVAGHALARTWTAWGIRPRAVVGEGVGEYVAACLAGALTLEDALALALARGQARCGRAGAFAEALARVSWRAPEQRWISSFTGTVVSDEQVRDRDFWQAQLGAPARGADGLAEVLAEPNWVLLETGVGGTLGALARRQPGFGERHVLLAATDEGTDLAALLATAARLWLAGVTLDWAGVHGRQQRRRVPLPTYPFERRRFWIEAMRSAWAPAGVPVAAAALDEPSAAPAAPAPEPAATATAPALAPAAAPPPLAIADPSTPLGRLMSQQLRVLSLQIEVLRQHRGALTE
jgi:acyl transferase domain-containing protein